MNINQLNFLNKNFGKRYARVEKGIATNAITGEVIPKDHIIKYFNGKDGLYEMKDMTCGGALPLGIGAEKAEPTEKNKEKYQCRVGRRAPKCDMYAKGKCAVYEFDDINNSPISLNVTEIIKIFNVDKINKF